MLDYRWGFNAATLSSISWAGLVSGKGRPPFSQEGLYGLRVVRCPGRGKLIINANIGAEFKRLTADLIHRLFDDSYCRQNEMG